MLLAGVSLLRLSFIWDLILSRQGTPGSARVLVLGKPDLSLSYSLTVTGVVNFASPLSVVLSTGAFGDNELAGSLTVTGVVNFASPLSVLSTGVFGGALSISSSVAVSFGISAGGSLMALDPKASVTGDVFGGPALSLVGLTTFGSLQSLSVVKESSIGSSLRSFTILLSAWLQTNWHLKRYKVRAGEQADIEALNENSPLALMVFIDHGIEISHVES